MILFKVILCIRILTIGTTFFFTIVLTGVVSRLAINVVVKVVATCIWIPLAVTPQMASALIDLYFLCGALLNNRGGLGLLLDNRDGLRLLLNDDRGRFGNDGCRACSRSLRLRVLFITLVTIAEECVLLRRCFLNNCCFRLLCKVQVVHLPIASDTPNSGGGSLSCDLRWSFMSHARSPTESRRVDQGC